MTNLIAQRRSTAAFVLKAFESDLMKVSAGGQFLAIQPGFALTPGFTTTENVELAGDIMSGKNIVTGEAPTGSLSHYFTGSGTPGTAPSYGTLLQATFGGYRNTAAEGTLAASSTTTELKFSTATAAAVYKKGDALLVKSVGGWEIRPVESVAGTTVTLGFALNSAPATGTKIGRLSTYFPISDQIPVFDAWHFIGGGESGVENVANCRTTSATLTVNAKDLINCAFSFEGTNYKFNEDFTESFVISSYNSKFNVVNTQGGTRTSTEVELEAKTYDDGAALAAEIQTKVSAVTGLTSFRATFATNRFSFTSTAAYLLDFFNVQTPPDGGLYLADVLGFERTDTSGVNPSTGVKASTKDARQTRSYASPVEPEYSIADPIVARGLEVFIGDATDNICIASASVTITLGTPKSLITSICEETGNYRSLINARTATMAISAYLEDDDRRFFDKFSEGAETKFHLNAGMKESNGNWTPGNVFSIYGSPCSITNWSVNASNEIYMLDLELTCFADGEEEGSIFVSYS